VRPSESQRSISTCQAGCFFQTAVGRSSGPAAPSKGRESPARRSNLIEQKADSNIPDVPGQNNQRPAPPSRGFDDLLENMEIAWDEWIVEKRAVQGPLPDIRDTILFLSVQYAWTWTATHAPDPRHAVRSGNLSQFLLPPPPPRLRDPGPQTSATPLSSHPNQHERGV